MSETPPEADRVIGAPASVHGIGCCISVKLPPFWRKDPELWFVQVESAFALARITSDDAKYHHVVLNLERTVLPFVCDILRRPPESNRYDAIKKRLINVFGESKSARLRTLLYGTFLGYEKPSMMLQQLRYFDPHQSCNAILRFLFLRNLPTNVRVILMAQMIDDLDELALLADKIMERQDPPKEPEEFDEEEPSSDKVDVHEIKNAVEELVNEIRFGSTSEGRALWRNNPTGEQPSVGEQREDQMPTNRESSGNDSPKDVNLKHSIINIPLPIRPSDMPPGISTEQLVRHQLNDKELEALLFEDASLKFGRARVDGSQQIFICYNSASKALPYIPKDLRFKIFSAVHDESHPDFTATCKLIENSCKWPDMNNDIATWINDCFQCQQAKTQSDGSNNVCNGEKPKLSQLPQPQLPDGRFEEVHLNFINFLNPVGDDKYLLTMIDRRTRWPEAVPMAFASAETVAFTFYEHWVCRFGCPRKITTDQGTQFQSTLFKTLTTVLGCTKVCITNNHPQANGVIEQWHVSLKEELLRHTESNWVDALDTVLLGFRTAIIEDIGRTPAELTYGTTLRIPNRLLQSSTKSTLDYSNSQLCRLMVKLPTSQTDNDAKSAFVFKDLSSCTHVFLRDDMSQGQKLTYRGPYKVIDRPSDKVFVVEVDGEEVHVLVGQVKPAHSLRI